MNAEYKEIITRTMEYGGILDVMLALQEKDGYLTPEAVEALAKAFNMFPSEVYDTASFYSMIKLTHPEGKTEILICRGAPCHVAGSTEVISAIEKALGIEIGGTTPDGKYSFEFTECIGQCQSSPSVLINGKLYTDMTDTKITDILKKGGLES